MKVEPTATLVEKDEEGTAWIRADHLVRLVDVSCSTLRRCDEQLRPHRGPAPGVHDPRGPRWYRGDEVPSIKERLRQIAESRARRERHAEHGSNVRDAALVLSRSAGFTISCSQVRRLGDRHPELISRDSGGRRYFTLVQLRELVGIVRRSTYPH